MPCLQTQLADLASDNTPVTSQLFGDHFAAEVMEIRSTNKCAASIAGPNSAIAGPSSGQSSPFRRGQGARGKMKFNFKLQNQSQNLSRPPFSFSKVQPNNNFLTQFPKQNLRGANYRGRGRGRRGRYN